MRCVAGVAFSFGEGRVLFLGCDCFCKPRVTFCTVLFACSPKKGWLIRGMRIMTGRATLSLDGQVVGDGVLRSNDVRVAVPAKFADGLLQDQALRKPMALVAGFAVFLLEGSVQVLLRFILRLGFLVAVVAGST